LLSAAAASKIYGFGGGGWVNFKIFIASAAAAVFFLQKSAAAAAEPLGLHL